MHVPILSHPTASNISPNFEGFRNSSAGTYTPLLVPDELKPMRFEPKLPSSAVFGLEYEPVVESIPKYEFSIEAENFIATQKKAVDYRKDLITISDKILAFLKNSNIEPIIAIELFQDPEYPDWLESKIVITVKDEDFSKTYAKYGNLLDYALKDIKKRTIEKLVVSIEQR